MKGKSISHPSRDSKTKNPEDSRFKGKTSENQLKKQQRSKTATEIYKLQREEAKRKSVKH
ncbi:hypothetical protein K8R43_00150 [archaeon]|nr:hypothetical protein [archaeon]